MEGCVNTQFDAPQACGLQFGVESPDLEGVFLNLTGRHLRDV